MATSRAVRYSKGYSSYALGGRLRHIKGETLG